MYVVFRLDRTVKVDVMGLSVSVPLSFADGMIGAMPVFKDKESAEAFANGYCKVEEVRAVPVNHLNKES